MSEYRVQLDAYAGPLDLLLYLVKRHEIDLHDIPIAKLTDQYMEHLRFIQQIDVDKAGEFLVMAATLLEIKSQVLMPRPEQAEDAADDDATEDESDPRYELVQQLLAYKRFKDAARALEKQHEDWSQRFTVHPVGQSKPEQPDDAQPVEIELDDANVLDLCQAFQRMLDSVGQSTDHQVTIDDTPISLHAEDIHDRLQREGPMTLQKMFEGRTNRSEMIGLFLATLELVREKKVRVLQDEPSGEIQLRPTTEDEQQQLDSDEPADWRNPETGEVQYDWPDEEGRKRAERRQRLREARARRDAGETTAEDDAALEEEPDDEGDDYEELDWRDDGINLDDIDETGRRNRDLSSDQPD